jgi:hypothetical protein
MIAEPVTDHDVRNLAGRYCEAVFYGDAEIFTSCWMPDAEWVVPGGSVIAGREDIVALYAKLRAPFVLCVQELLSGVIDLDPHGRHAHARWQIREIQRRDDGRTNCVIGTYTDDVVRDLEGVCRFARRRFDVRYRGPLDLTGTIHPTS